MLGRFNLPNVCEDDLYMNCASGRPLDSPDSGLPPSPCPSAWLQPAWTSPRAEEAGGGTPEAVEVNVLVGTCASDSENGLISCDNQHIPCCLKTQKAGAVTAFSPLFRPLSYREEIELDPLPPKVVRYTSSVRYDSDRHFIQCVSLQPRGFGLESCSQTVVALSHNTWRYYRTQLSLEPRQRAQRYQSTSIVYPKHACAIYVTHLHYDCRRHTRRFLSGVELEPLHG